MKKYTKEELQDIVEKVMGPEEWTIKIIKQMDNELLFEATHMYDWNDYKPTLKQLLEFSKEFGTENIDKYDDIAIGGCETCDFWSSYGFALRIWE